MAAKVHDLEDVLDALHRSAKDEGAKVSVDEILATFGRRSFGPLLLLCGLLGMTPVSGIPSVPSILAVITVLIAGQMVFGREAIWIPRFIAKLSVAADKIEKAVRVSRKPARWVDKVVRPRLHALTSPLADRLVAAACVLVALAVPPLELVPFAAFIPSLAIFTFGLGLVARDGLVVLVALLLSAAALGLIGWRLLGG
ncbi:MAG: exopolysaccharide biosynthesis protein [Phenylobacterium sp.]|uniref:exopolysaccharide biosynthesis protein n=1 Tax=Phenylobacterium sp. TaxID=1871053 RepID=UPI001A5E22D7|nr:exopolysaccharide biosynthesis protein [Phenylobacterium sp.]MBL8771332.1 exopolysaccharide biosynthesis protein [Phenylobacterium sp.]